MIQLDSSKIKSIVLESGADLCGIADIDRFSEAPEGFKPTDIYQSCQSVIVFAKRVPKHCINADSCVPYSHVNSLITQAVDQLTLQLSTKLEDLGINNVIIPSDDPYEYWVPERMYGRAILSLRHAGYLAGLGVLGKNTLLINDKFGNMIQLGAILIDEKLESDPIADYEGCIKECRLCLDACPNSALDSITVNQKLCRPVSNFITAKGYNLKKCYECRKVCPHFDGIK